MCRLLIALSLAGLSGCLHPALSRRARPINRWMQGHNGPWRASNVSSSESPQRTTSIGDIMFTVKRFEWRPGEDTVDTVLPASPVGSPFPGPSKWLGRYDYQDEDGIVGVLYTTPAFYKGKIGVVLDVDGHLAGERPLVQIKQRLGLLGGRDWQIPGWSGHFFAFPGSSPGDPVTWGLRYGGAKDGRHIFEIVNTAESTVIQVLQTITVSEQNLAEGISIRQVLLKARRTSQPGEIAYTIRDTWPQGQERSLVKVDK